MTAKTNSHAHGGPSGIHVVPVWLLGAVLGALLVLTWVTVAATWIDLGSLNLWIAMAIATVKGSLVALYFMHLRWERLVNSIFFIGALLFVMLFVGLALMDTAAYQPELIPDYAPGIQR
jgi:cytochrome c oxidase subunit 4